MSKQFYLLANGGLVMTLISVLMFYMQGKNGLFEMMRPYVIITNFLTLGWFIALQYFRFKQSGRTCAGDDLTFRTPSKMPKDWESLFLVKEGQFFLYYIVAHYFVYVL